MPELMSKTDDRPGSNVPESLIPGDLVEIRAGALEGAVGTVMKRTDQGCLLVGLAGANEGLAVRIPETLLYRHRAD